jgi:type IV pilus biogenesis protein CpaD/CtpE
MQVSRISILAVVLVVIAVALAGCSGSPSSSSTVTAAPGSPGSTSSASTAAGAGTDMVSGSQLLGGLTYEWTEYKITSNTGGEQVIMYFKYNQKTGKCTMRIEGMEDTTGMLSNIDCSSSGSTSDSASDPNDIGSDVKLTKVSTETVTVPAGTFVADKYTTTANGVTATYWITTGKPLLKMEGGSNEGTVITELNGWG